MPERYLAEALATRPDHYAVVATAPSGAVIALASCRAVAPGTAELAVLVEDEHQRLGLGGFLLQHLITHAERVGVTLLEAAILHEQSWVARLLNRYGTCETAYRREAIEVTLRLAT
jgi:GNAT superfamily N-acetyltransferase